MATLPQSNRALRACAGLACLLSLVQACGRSDPEDYLYGSDGSIDVGATAGLSSGGQSGGGTRATGGTTGRAGSGSTAGTANIGGGITTGGSLGTGGINFGGSSPVGGSSPIGGTGQGGTGRGGTTGVGGVGTGGIGVAGSGGAGSPVTCGDQSCDSSTQVCCASLGGFGCLSKNAACNGAVLSCTISADCSGNDVCCLSLTGNAETASSCKPVCNGMGPSRDRQLCRTDADCGFPNRFCTQTVFGVSVCTRR